MIVKYRKAFFNDVSKIRLIKQVEDIEFITETQQGLQINFKMVKIDKK